MLRIDSITLKTTTDAIKDVNLDYFNEMNYRQLKNDAIIKKSYLINKDIRPFGLKNISINDNDIKIELSGKILKSDYYNLINKNNIFNAIGNINSKAISFNKYSLLDAQVLKLDITNNIPVNEPIKRYMKMLFIYSKNSDKYLINKYQYSGLVFVKNNATKKLKDRLITYNKTIEIQRDERLLKLLKNINDFKNILRFESNLRTFSQIRKRLEIDNKLISLRDVLSVKAKVNYNFLSEILKTSSTNANLINKEKKASQIIREAGFQSIFKEFGMKKAKEYIKLITPEGTTAPYYYIKQMKEAVNINLENNNSYINEIKGKLKNAI